MCFFTLYIYIFVGTCYSITSLLILYVFKKNLGIKTLLDVCNIDADISTYHLGFVIGPRINAGGRVGKCSHGANLLLNNSAKETFKIAVELNNFNKERQLLESELLSKILNI